MLEELTEKNNVYQVLYTTLYSYDLSSHYIHYDGQALQTRSDSLRNQAIGREYEIDKAHILRIISNVLTMMVIRVSEYIRQYNISTPEVVALVAEAMKLQEEIDGLVEELIKNKY